MGKILIVSGLPYTGSELVAEAARRAGFEFQYGHRGMKPGLLDVRMHNWYNQIINSFERHPAPLFTRWDRSNHLVGVMRARRNLPDGVPEASRCVYTAALIPAIEVLHPQQVIWTIRDYLPWRADTLSRDRFPLRGAKLDDMFRYQNAVLLPMLKSILGSNLIVFDAETKTFDAEGELVTKLLSTLPGAIEAVPE